MPRSSPLTDHPQYKCWANIIKRTENLQNPSYARYGGRGIKLWPAWRADSQAFLDWLDDNLGPRPDGFSLDRIDNDGDYEPGNLRWASDFEQQQNTERVLRVGRIPLSTDIPGVHRRRGRWIARLGKDGVQHYLGSFATAEEAGAAVSAARTQ